MIISTYQQVELEGKYTRVNAKVSIIFGPIIGESFDLSKQLLNGSNGMTITGFVQPYGKLKLATVDFDGDNYKDLIISDNKNANTYILWNRLLSSAPAVFDISELTKQDSLLKGTKIHNDDGSDHVLGYTVKDAGDVNGDGINDVIFGGKSLTNMTILYGKAERFWKKSMSIQSFFNELEVKRVSKITNRRRNISRSNFASGDINNDGYHDIIGYAGKEKRINVFLGSPKGLPQTIVVADAINLDNVISIAKDDFKSMNVIIETADLNGDNYDDIIISNNYPLSAPPETFIIYGGPQFAL